MKVYIIGAIGIIIVGAIFVFGQNRTQEELMQRDQNNKQLVQPDIRQFSQDRQSGSSATINGAMLDLEIARTREEQTKGLSGRESLAENTGMLFPYENPSIPGFWMPDMHFAIDIIWIDQNKKVVGISENVAPETYPAIFRPPSPIVYVLEVNAGWSAAHNVAAGDEVVFNGVF